MGKQQSAPDTQEYPIDERLPLFTHETPGDDDEPTLKREATPAKSPEASPPIPLTPEPPVGEASTSPPVTPEPPVGDDASSPPLEALTSDVLDQAPGEQDLSSAPTQELLVVEDISLIPTQEMLLEEEFWMQQATSGLADVSPTQPLPRISLPRLKPSARHAVPARPRPSVPPVTPSPSEPSALSEQRDAGPLPPEPSVLPEQRDAEPLSPEPSSLRPTRLQEAVALALLILVVAGSLVGLRFFPQTTVAPSSPANITGPFVQQPLDAAQIDALRHLASRMQARQLASLYVSRMTLDEEIGQLIMVEYSDTSYSADLDTMVNQLHAGGVIMYEFQMLTADQTKHDIAQMQQRAKLPLFISTDEEGGPWVHRLKNIYGLRKSALDIYNSGDVAVATQEGHKVARDLLSLGINENLAPDVDVALVNGIDQVTRTFGFTPDSVIKYAGPYMKAMQSDGVIACIKHFPGLGDATVDAHTQLPIVNRTKQQLYDVELAPFKYFVQSPDQLERPGMVMPTDVLMPAIDPVMPAELSHTFMTNILRKEFGYDGVVLTDALYMGGVVVNGAPISMTQAAVMALNAGDDMILGPDGTDQTLAVINAIKAALQDGTLSKARIDEAATRIIALKIQDHLMPAVPPQV